MIVGSGMLARGFEKVGLEMPHVWIHAAGVSNSSCQDPFEFARERRRVSESLSAGTDAGTFIYFSTCSVYDPHTRASSYVLHKCEMERAVLEHPRSLVVRLPQVAARTPNPHTLLNYLYSRISRSERFALWKDARRNVIDIIDVVRIVRRLLETPGPRRTTVNVANTRSYSISEIVAAMESATGKKAIVDVKAEGGAYAIDTSAIAPIIDHLGMEFGDEYLPLVIHRYYGMDNEGAARAVPL